MSELSQSIGYVRMAGEKDLPDIMDIWQKMAHYHELIEPSYFRKTNTTETIKHYFLSAMGRENAQVLVGVEGGEIVGFVVGELKRLSPIFKEKWKGQVAEIGILGDEKRTTLMLEMMQSLFNWFRKKDILRVEVSVHAQNHKSQAIWRQLGFVPYLSQMARELSD